MDFSLLLALLAGWCGNEPPLFPKIPGKWPPLEPGDWPPNCPKCGVFASLLGGVIFVLVARQFFPQDLGLASTLAAGFIGGRIGGRIGSYVGGKMGFGK